MILTMHVGNSSIYLGVFKDEGLACKVRLSTVSRRTSDEWAHIIRGTLDNYDVKSDFTGAIVSSVVPPLTQSICDGIKLLCGVSPLVVGPGIKTGLEICIDNPAQLGADMVCTAVAVKTLYGTPAIIFDFGTATTLSVLDKSGRFLGVAIIPGVKASLDALSEKTAQLPHISLERPERVIGKNTIDSMRSGVLYGYASMLDGMTARIETELGYKCAVFTTGGMSEDISGLAERETVWNETLLLQGLMLLYKRNVNPA